MTITNAAIIVFASLGLRHPLALINTTATTTFSTLAVTHMAPKQRYGYIGACDPDSIQLHLLIPFGFASL